MSFTTPIYIPLVEGLDLSKDATMGQRELRVAENIDFGVQGEARGRPSRAAPVQFVVRTAGGGGGPAYLSAADFDDTGFTPLGLMRHRDASGERPMLGCAGRLFGLEDSLWRDYGHFSCARVDRVRTSFQHEDNGSVIRALVGPDFAQANPTANDTEVALLNPDGFGYEKTVALANTPSQVGGSARCGSVTATLYRSGSNLYLVTRTAGGSSLTETLLASDANAGDGLLGDAPSISCDHDQTVFFVAYRTTTADQFKVLRVSTAGSVSATYISTETDLFTIWVANSDVATNRVLVALGSSTGAAVRVLNATTMVSTGVSLTDATGAAREIVVGVETSTRSIVAYRSSDDSALYILAFDYSTGFADVLMTYYGGTIGSRYFTPMHQPILVDGRMYLTIATAMEPRETSLDPTGLAVGTWFTLDLSNLWQLGGTGPFPRPTLVARGPLNTTAHTGGIGGSAVEFQPESAVLWDDGSWTFASHEWTDFQAMDTENGDFATGVFIMGLHSVTVLNRIALSGPRAAQAGGVTLISGSVPHLLAGGECYEAGFPAGAPYVESLRDGGDGTITEAGSYTIYVLWAYTDPSGAVHRSTPLGFTQQMNANDALNLFIENPWFSERPTDQLRIEVYSTGPNPASGDPAHLQATITPDFSSGATHHKLWAIAASEELKTDTLVLYLSDTEFAHVTPPADGGIAALGRRIWVASGTTAYASLLLQPGKGVTWNDEGSLSVDLPAGAGRIVALEALDDKLIIFCERGIYMTQDGGPDNTGSGPDLAFPIRLTDLGCAGPRSTCTTDRGVVFCSPFDETDPQRGGPWLLDRSLSLTERKYLGTPAMDFFAADWVPEVAFSPERQQVYVTVPTADALNSTSGVVVIDLRMSKWSTWGHLAAQGAIRSVDCVRGILWSLGDQPAGFTGAPGSDAEGDYHMRIETAEMASNGQDGLGWGRVRSVSVLHARGSGAYDLSMAARMDQDRLHASGAMTVTASALTTTWPSNRQAPEWRLPVQKCGSLQVSLYADSGVARWTAIRLDVQPLPGRTPAKLRT